MTTIAALTVDGRVYLATDSQSTHGDSPIPGIRKAAVFKVGDKLAVIATSGAAGLTSLFASQLDIERPHGDRDAWANGTARAMTKLAKGPRPRRRQRRHQLARLRRPTVGHLCRVSRTDPCRDLRLRIRCRLRPRCTHRHRRLDATREGCHPRRRDRLRVGHLQRRTMVAHRGVILGVVDGGWMDRQRPPRPTPLRLGPVTAE